MSDHTQTQEAMGRALCRERGVDPEDMKWASYKGFDRKRKNWQWAADEIIDLHRKLLILGMVE